MTAPDWPAATPLGSPRLLLEPLTAGHAVELAPLLDDARLHEYVGGSPPTAVELSARLQRQAAGRSPDGRQGWLNWVVRSRAHRTPVGTVQATLFDDAGRRVAELAWVVGTDHQGHGYAGEAAETVQAWLREQGVQVFRAHIHPAHGASQGVARRVGLAPTEVIVDGETRWQG